MSKFTNDVVAVGHGFVIASLFVLLILNQGASVIGWLTHAAADVAGGTAAVIGGGIDAASQSNVVRDMVEDSVADLNLKDAQAVIPGMASRLLRGDTEGAKAYLACQSGKSFQEVDARIGELKAQLDQSLVKAREATATTMKATGCSLLLAKRDPFVRSPYATSPDLIHSVPRKNSFDHLGRTVRHSH